MNIGISYFKVIEESSKEIEREDSSASHGSLTRQGAVDDTETSTDVTMKEVKCFYCILKKLELI